MIRLLLRVVGPDARPRLTRMIIWQCLDAVAAGAALALTVPLLRDLLRPQDGHPGWWLLTLVLACVLYAAVHWVSLEAALTSGSVISRGLHHRLGDHLTSLPMGWFSGDRTGEVSTLTSRGVNDVMGIAAHLLRPVIAAILTPATTVVALILIDWRLGVAALAALAAVSVTARWAARLSDEADLLAHEARVESADRVIEFARLQPVLRASNASGANARLVQAALTGSRDAAARQLRTAVPGRVATGLVLQATFVALLALATALAIDDAIDIALALATMTLLVRFVEPLTGLAGLAGALQRSRASLQRIADILSTPPLPEPSSPMTPEGNDVRLDEVSFGYGDQAVLHEITAILPDGTVTALVGPSGAGKSTLAWLVARFYDVTDGSVSIGGVDVRHLAADELSNRLAFVFQHAYLFTGTIEDNIFLARPDASRNELAAAASAARVDEIVARLPDGWDTQVGEGGKALSGGERQRVSIARALLKDAPIVILDEPTSALDAENAVAVAHAVNALMQRRTVLVIAHQLDTIRDADQILFLDAGRVVERGTHQELLASNGPYARFWAQREAAVGWRLSGD